MIRMAVQAAWFRGDMQGMYDSGVLFSLVRITDCLEWHRFFVCDSIE